MAANSGLPEGASFSWGEMWTLLNWLCIEFLAVTGHVLYVYVVYSKTSCLCNFFLTMSDFELQRSAYYSCFFLPAPDNRS